jgi:hypothetical protein
VIVFTAEPAMRASYTRRQGEFLTFIHRYIQLNQRSPSEAEMQKHFGVTPPTVHQMVLTLEKRKLIQRTPGEARSLRLLIHVSQLPAEESKDSGDSPPSDAILGDWRIIKMDLWEQDFVDADVEGYIRFDSDDTGEFQFGYVYGRLDCELTQRDGRPAIEWSWEGNDEMDPASGRGWAMLQTDGTLKGSIRFHRGDRSGFSAVRRGGPKVLEGRMLMRLGRGKRKK